uniref:Cf0 subunit i of atp synthase n=1 Tax=Prototheca cutis TaxID=575411 RepID=A0A2Z6BEQ1_9CHLO|nr:cf0 subunit i of atp synthase [Prototheca cutis]BBD20202.1 cf0 subunit i of atp synthase [Prototheca cutis]
MLDFNYLKINQFLFETNLINLSLVISIVIFFLDSKLQYLLNNRRKKIVSNFFEAEVCTNNEKNNVIQALGEKINALNKILLIEIKTFSIIEKEKQFFKNFFLNGYIQLKKNQYQFFHLEKQKIIKCFYKNLSHLSLTKIKQKLKETLKLPIQKKINNYKIIDFINYLKL